MSRTHKQKNIKSKYSMNDILILKYTDYATILPKNPIEKRNARDFSKYGYHKFEAGSKVMVLKEPSGTEPYIVKDIDSSIAFYCSEYWLEPMSNSAIEGA